MTNAAAHEHPPLDPRVASACPAFCPHQLVRTFLVAYGSLGARRDSSQPVTGLRMTVACCPPAPPVSTLGVTSTERSTRSAPAASPAPREASRTPSGSPAPTAPGCCASTHLAAARRSTGTPASPSRAMTAGASMPGRWTWGACRIRPRRTAASRSSARPRSATSLRADFAGRHPSAAGRPKAPSDVPDIHSPLYPATRLCPSAARTLPGGSGVRPDADGASRSAATPPPKCTGRSAIAQRSAHRRNRAPIGGSAELDFIICAQRDCAV